MSKFFNICSILLTAALLLFACVPGRENKPINSTIPRQEPYPIESPTHPNLKPINPPATQPTDEDRENYPPAVWAAVEDLVSQLAISPEQVQVISFQEEEWPDSCLGLAAPDEMCLQVITPGYRILLSANEMRFEYHSDQTGDILRIIGDTQLGPIKPGLNKDNPRAILAAMQIINQSTGITINEIKVVSIEAAEWADSCLGLAKLDEMCAEGITPGWNIILEAKGRTYEFHTNLSGESIRMK